MGAAPPQPEQLRRLVADTGPLLHLYEAGALALLSLAGSVVIPPAVDAEMASHLPEWPGVRPAWVAVEPLEPPYRAVAEGWVQAGLLDRGEAEAIRLARQVGADWLLTDDAAARLVAGMQGLEVHGSLGIVLWAAATGHLELGEAERVLDGLAASSLWVSAPVLAEARAALRRLFP
jgi:predicted nucleic acid-binding protein